MIHITVCRCGHYDVRSLDRCVNCGQPLRAVTLEARGQVLTWTILHNVPEGLPRPLRLVLVELANGMKMLCRGSAACEEVGRQVRIREESGIFHCDPWDRWTETRSNVTRTVSKLWQKFRPRTHSEREVERRLER